MIECMESAYSLACSKCSMSGSCGFFSSLLLPLSQFCPWFSFSGVGYFYCSFIILCIPCWPAPDRPLPRIGVSALIQNICGFKGTEEPNASQHMGVWAGKSLLKLQDKGKAIQEEGFLCLCRMCLLQRWPWLADRAPVALYPSRWNLDQNPRTQSHSPLGPGGAGWRKAHLAEALKQDWPEVDLLLWKVEFFPTRVGLLYWATFRSHSRKGVRSGVEEALRFDVVEPPLHWADAQVKAILVPSRWEQRCQCDQGQPAMNCFLGDSLSYSSTQSFIYRMAVLGSFLSLPDSSPALEDLGSIFTHRWEVAHVWK